MWQTVRGHPGLLVSRPISELTFSQWLAAHQSKRDFNPSGFGNGPAKDGWYKFRWIRIIFTKGTSTENSSTNERWTMKDAFFTNIGGFILRTTDQAPFPIDAKQLHYLVSRGYLEWSKLDHRMIDDKNKVNGLLRTITICQIT